MYMQVGIVRIAASELLVRVGLRGISGATDTTRTTTPRVIVSPNHVHQRRASKKAKTVDEESGTSKYCTGRSGRVERVDRLPRVAAVGRKPYTEYKKGAV